MFANTKAFSGFAVDDVQKARAFYGETLGLKTSEEHGLLTLERHLPRRGAVHCLVQGPRRQRAVRAPEKIARFSCEEPPLSAVRT